MADESTQAAPEQATQEEPQGTDWKAEARKWEARAKENKGAAEELEQLKREQMTEIEKARADAADAKAEAEQLKAEKAMSDAAADVSAKSGIPVSMLRHCASVEDMHAFADEWATYHESLPAIHSAPATSATRIVKPDAPKATNGAVFAHMFAE